MHKYAAQGIENQTIGVLVVVGTVSASLVYIFSFILNLLFSYGLSFSIQTPSAVLLYGFIFKFFDACAWKWAIFRMIGVVKTPDLNGHWNVTIVPQKSEKIDGNMKITQTFSNILIKIETNNSTSYSISASVFVDTPETVTIRNQYKAERKNGSNITNHEGANKILFNLDGKKFRPNHGSYFTEGKRDTHGHFKFS